MASAWGVSWGVSWGNSWGSITSDVVETDQQTGGGKKRRKHYPRRVMVYGQVFTVRDYHEERQLLQAMLDRVHAADAAVVSEVSETVQPPKAAMAIRRRIQRVEQEQARHLERLRQIDEEIILLM